VRAALETSLLASGIWTRVTTSPVIVGQCQRTTLATVLDQRTIIARSARFRRVAGRPLSALNGRSGR
jgi:hypothetical protein